MAKAKKLSFKKSTKADRKRREIADAILKDNPGISDEKKFKFATAAAKKSLKKRKG